MPKQTTAMYFPPSQFSHRFGTQFYTVLVKSSRVVYDKDRKCKFAVYEFEIKRGRQKKIVFYRYSEIRQLHEYLCSTNVGSIANLVAFPSKTWFTRLDEKFLDERRAANYGIGHLHFCSQATLRVNEISLNFLLREKNLENHMNDHLRCYLEKNGLQLEEVSDIITKYDQSQLQIIYKEIENYLQIKREIDSFPTELRQKILQYARDTAHIGVSVDKIRQQIKNELISIQEARMEIDKTMKTMNKLNDKTIDGIAKNSKLDMMLMQFINSVDDDLQKRADMIVKNKRNKLSSKILAIIDSRRSAEIGVRTLIDRIHSIDNTENDHSLGGVPYNIICQQIGKQIERDLYLQSKLCSAETQQFIANDWENPMEAKLDLAKHLGVKIGDSFDQRTLIETGALIMSSIVDCCLIGMEKEKAFVHTMHYGVNQKAIGIVCTHPELTQILAKELRYRAPNECHPVAKPMIIPPRRWKNIDEGPFFYYNESLMRYIDYKNQYKPLRAANMDDLFQCLNILQSTAWKINERVLNVMEYLYCVENGNVAGLPNKADYEMPKLSDFETEKEYEYKLSTMKKLNAELHSLRCDLVFKLKQAKELLSEDEIYFPLNIDFRGRIYPISPHINHIGSDYVRGMMMFAKKKKLGKRGWFWLNVNLANKFGFDKVVNEERFNWALQHRSDVLSVCSDPLKNRWWLSADSPFQALSTCIELGNAYNFEMSCGSVYEYASCLPVGQDGSCNGLQHYAAMLRDEKMAKVCSFALMCLSMSMICPHTTQHVNVANNHSERGDVYSAVQQCVVRMVADDYNAKDTESRKHKLAQIIHGKVTRKIVKQTVMTSVYGVTSYGAKAQIMKWLSSAIENGSLTLTNDSGESVDAHSEEGHALLLELGIYLSRYTLYGIGLTNTPAYLSMLWLKNSAAMIAQNGYRVSWMTPILNLPCTQHYCEKNVVVRTNKQCISYVTHSSDNKKDINVGKQSGAFPPNFVHSLDSTHCMLTARECYLKHGLSFASIHDSFWTHPCDIDIMSKVLREQFIKLHAGNEGSKSKRSLLGNLYRSFCLLYPDIQFSPPPNHSSFDLEQVKDSQFFFS